MPTYEYKCTECGHLFELFQSMKDDPITECIKCHGRVKRLIGTGAGIIFKGSGFYCTDYRSPSYSQAASKDKAPPASKTTSSSDTSEKKTPSSPDAASPAKGAKKGD